MGLREAWDQIINAANSGTPNNISTPALVVLMMMGGILALHVRFLFRHFSVSASSSDSISRVFPLLTIVITAVIVVLDSSWQLTLGLVGALSIVRFRTAIKDPEEIIYLFLCIALGLALGANQPLYAVALTATATLFVIGMQYFEKKRRRQNLLLTISGDPVRNFSDSESDVLAMVKKVAGDYELQRYDVEEGRGQVRLILPPTTEQKTIQIMGQLRDLLPDCELSYVNLNSTL